MRACAHACERACTRARGKRHTSPCACRWLHCQVQAVQQQQQQQPCCCAGLQCHSAGQPLFARASVPAARGACCCHGSSRRCQQQQQPAGSGRARRHQGADTRTPGGEYCRGQRRAQPRLVRLLRPRSAASERTAAQAARGAELSMRRRLASNALAQLGQVAPLGEACEAWQLVRVEPAYAAELWRGKAERLAGLAAPLTAGSQVGQRCRSAHAGSPPSRATPLTMRAHRPLHEPSRADPPAAVHQQPGCDDAICCFGAAVTHVPSLPRAHACWHPLEHSISAAVSAVSHSPSPPRTHTQRAGMTRRLWASACTMLLSRCHSRCRATRGKRPSTPRSRWAPCGWWRRCRCWGWQGWCG